MICLRCNKEEFRWEENAVVEQLFRGKTIKVQTPAMVCLNCGSMFLADGMADELYKRTLNAYQNHV